VKISDKGLDLIKSFESLRLEAYMPTPNDVPTIGFGHTNSVQMGDTCTEQDATDWLRDDCAEAENCVNKHVRVPIAQNEFDALVSLAFNIGCGAFAGSTVLKLLNNHDFDGAAAQFPRWSKQNGKELAGLVRRRLAEKEMFA